MMNMFEVGERLKDFSKNQLIQEMQSPSGIAPQFLVLSELQRRMRMERSMAGEQDQPQSTVAQDAVSAAAGVPQGGLQDMAQALAPQTDMDGNTGVAPVARMQEGGSLSDISRNLEDYAVGAVGPGARSGMRWVNGRLIDEYGREVDLPAAPLVRSRAPRAPREPAEVGRYTRLPYMEDPLMMDDRLLAGRTVQELSDMGVSPEMIVSAPDFPRPAESDAYTALPYIEDPSVLDAVRRMSRASPGRGIDTPEEISVAPNLLPTSPGMTAPTESDAYTALPYIEDPSVLDAVRRMRRVSPGRALPTISEVDEPTYAMQGPVRELGDPTDFGIDDLRAGRGFGRLAYGADIFTPANTGTSIVDAIAEQLPSRESVIQDIKDTAAIISPLATKEEKEAAAESMGVEELPPAAETPTVAPTMPGVERTPAAARTAGPSGAGGAGGGAAGAGADYDRMYEQDKWLSLARMGMALMASQAPTFGQALGEAGTTGLDALSRARESFQERREAAEMMALRRAAAAARAASGEGLPGIGVSSDTQRLLDRLDDTLSRLKIERAGMEEGGWFTGQDPRIPEYDKAIQNIESRIRAITDVSAGGGLFSGAGQTPTYSMTDVR